MKKRHSLPGALAVCAALLVGLAVPTAAGQVAIGLTPDEDNLFLQMNDLMPGESRSDTFTITNLGSDTYTFYL